MTGKISILLGFQWKTRSSNEPNAKPSKSIGIESKGKGAAISIFSCRIQVKHLLIKRTFGIIEQGLY